jgi:hypothetical protein
MEHLNDQALLRPPEKFFSYHLHYEQYYQPKISHITLRIHSDSFYVRYFKNNTHKILSIEFILCALRTVMTSLQCWNCSV